MYRAELEKRYPIPCLRSAVFTRLLEWLHHPRLAGESRGTSSTTYLMSGLEDWAPNNRNNPSRDRRNLRSPFRSPRNPKYRLWDRRNLICRLPIPIRAGGLIPSLGPAGRVGLSRSF
jgi:hypothetical protein